MPPIKDVSQTNTSFYQKRPLVAAFIGGTSGIGEFAAIALAKQYANQGQLLRVYIVGRSSSAAERIIASCRQICSQGVFLFIKADDLSTLQDVDKVSKELARSEEVDYGSSNPRIDLLFMTQGIVTFEGRQENREGLDITMSLIYYSRIRFIQNLVPLLDRAQKQAHVVSVFGAGLEGKLFKDDLSLRHPKNNNPLNRRSHVAFMTTMAFEHLAKEHPNISFAHHYPGLVLTPVFSSPDFPIWFKIIWRIIGPLAVRFYAYSKEESGERSLFIGTDRYPSGSRKIGTAEGAFDGTDAKSGSGAYAVGQKTEPVPLKDEYVGLKKSGFKRTVWDHTMDCFDSITKTGRFIR